MKAAAAGIRESGGSGKAVRPRAHRREKPFEREGKTAEKKRRYDSVLLFAALLIGMCLLLYPSLADYWNSFHQSRAIMDYSTKVSEMDAEEYAALIEEAEAYNAWLAGTGTTWSMGEEQQKRYEGLLNFTGTGVMGYIDIPKINVKLPIYHGTDEAVLQTSIGHIRETSLPVGGAGSHCALSGHRGLPSAKLFSDLDKVIEGDTFTLSILNETYTYQVDRIRVVQPSDVSALQIVPGEDLCTLITCTPYGINTHRLLVRGHRVENAHGDAQVVADALQMEPAFVAPFVMAPMLAILLIVLAIRTSGERL